MIYENEALGWVSTVITVATKEVEFFINRKKELESALTSSRDAGERRAIENQLIIVQEEIRKRQEEENGIRKSLDMKIIAGAGIALVSLIFVTVLKRR